MPTLVSKERHTTGRADAPLSHNALWDCRDASGWSVGSGRVDAHAMCVLVLCGRVTGPGAAVCWQHPVHMEIEHLTDWPSCRAGQ